MADDGWKSYLDNQAKKLDKIAKKSGSAGIEMIGCCDIRIGEVQTDCTQTAIRSVEGKKIKVGEVTQLPKK